jgi:hypothetical protein
MFGVTTNVTFANDGGNALGDASGNPLVVGSLVEIGSFNISNSAIQTLAAVPGGEAALLSHFTQYGSSGFIGDGSYDNNSNPLAGFFYDTTINASTNALSIQHTPIYLIAFNAGTSTAATSQLILTSLSTNLIPTQNSWVFPADADIPNTQVFETDSASSLVVVGSSVVKADSALAVAAQYGTGTTFAGAAIIPVPEPATWASLVGGLALVGAFVARRRSVKA